MKLIYCPRCRDMVRLRAEEERRCLCGLVYGKYRLDGDHADISKHAIPIGIANPDLYDAARRYPDKVTAIRAWVDKGPSWHIIENEKGDKDE